MQKRKRQVLGRLGIEDTILWKGRTDSNPPGWVRVYPLSRNLAQEAPSQDSPNLFSFLYNSPFRNSSHRVGGGGEEGACAWSWFLGRICGFAGRMHIFPHWYDRKMWVSLGAAGHRCGRGHPARHLGGGLAEWRRSPLSGRPASAFWRLGGICRLVFAPRFLSTLNELLLPPGLFKLPSIPTPPQRLQKRASNHLCELLTISAPCGTKQVRTQLRHRNGWVHIRALLLSAWLEKSLKLWVLASLCVKQIIIMAIINLLRKVLWALNRTIHTNCY